MSLIRNEQTKLLANYLNGLAVAVFAVGAFSPIVSAIYAAGSPSWFTSVVGLVCFAVSGALHYGGYLTLRRLQP